jgi:hypothetical protein
MGEEKKVDTDGDLSVLPVPVDVLRLLRPFHVGDRVRASLDIHYGAGLSIGEGAIGTVRTVRSGGCSGLHGIEWDAFQGELQTAADCFDPLYDPDPRKSRTGADDAEDKGGAR